MVMYIVLWQYSNCCTSCCFQLKNFHTIDFLKLYVIHYNYIFLLKFTPVIKFMKWLRWKKGFPTFTRTLGFGMISILSASASTRRLMAFKFTHLPNQQ